MKKHALILTVLGLMACAGQVQADGDLVAQAPQGPNVATCSSLSKSQQQFSNTLNTNNQIMFCNMMNDSQRSAAMGMVGKPDAKGNNMSPDAAVEKVARDNNMTLQGGGSCSAK